MSVSTAPRRPVWLGGRGDAPLNGANALRAVRGSLTAKALLASRLLVVLAGVCGVLTGSAGLRWGPTNIGLGSVGNVLAGSAVRFDANWYLAIARHGYAAAGAGSRAFWPLYPDLIRVLGYVLGSDVIAGVAISVASFAGALVLLRRLAELELGKQAADATILLLAFAPLSFFFSAVYTESLFLLLSVASIYAARRERWFIACALAGLATLTRTTGVALIVPLVLMLRPWRGLASRRLRCLILVPGPLIGYLVWLALTGHSWLAPFQAQAVWHRTTVGPLAAIAEAVGGAAGGVARIVTGAQAVYHPSQVGVLTPAAESIFLLLALIVAVYALVGCWRRLPRYYGAYAATALIMCLSDPISSQPLESLDRYLLTIFPLWMVAGDWIAKRRLQVPTILISSAALVFYTFWFSRYAFIA
ncbi:MAG TPA: mannosyltransferase family protein [Solirubrobacteraceae bacterium]|nr:mannosyltransferase family protein [Solirubrobacteraceae bacterium]